jgi:hypothetical protein
MSPDGRFKSTFSSNSIKLTVNLFTPTSKEFVPP